MKTKFIVPRDQSFFECSDFETWLRNLESVLVSVLKFKPFPFDSLAVIIKKQRVLVNRISNLGGLEIHCSLDYLLEYSSDQHVVIREAKGLVIHQLIDCHLDISALEIPSNITSGLCDAVRLALDCPNSKWKKSKREWDEGGFETAYFFQFLAANYESFLANFFQLIETTGYRQSCFKLLTGSSVEELWIRYRGFTIDKIENVSVVNESDNETFSLLVVYPSSQDYPRLDNLTLFVRDMDGVAHTKGGKGLYSSEIHLSTAFISSFLVKHGLVEARKELEGILRHEMVHVIQSNGFGTLPGGMVEGVADYFRLKGGFPSISWKETLGGSWTDGYSCTAFFLEWLDKKIPLIVMKLNAALLDQMWSENLFANLAGKEIELLWIDYQNEL